ncbi:YCF48-related protein [Fulvivirgaceae bacterium BMA12]|uniref:YCF48-related protein n=1 Tax=Agaribacillus aureus TaxID=3051825 RepID=A0ABT8LDX6_9BACT|nr:YCF48-related protein [Fulvivirgaceae bacterium BMA12]
MISHKLYSLAIILAIILQPGCNTGKSAQEESTAPQPSHWQILPTPDVDASLRGLCTVSEKIAWASGTGGTVLLTVDGGQTWTRRQVPNTDSLDFRDILAFDENICFIISIGLPAKIFKTTDGGKNWMESYSNEKEGVFFDAIDFWDRQHGIAFSDPVDGHLLIITTGDGGDTWQEIPKENIPPALEGEGGFAASGTCLTVYGDKYAWIGSGGVKASRVFRSADKGQTWQVAETPVIQGRPSTGIFSLAFKDPLNGIAVGGDYRADRLRGANAAITRDGGKSWVLITKNQPNGFKSCVTHFGDPKKNYLIAVGTSGTDYSLDGGNTWRFMDTTAYHVASFSKDGTAGFAAGPKGRIAKFIMSEN